MSADEHTLSAEQERRRETARKKLLELMSKSKARIGPDYRWDREELYRRFGGPCQADERFMTRPHIPLRFMRATRLNKGVFPTAIRHASEGWHPMKWWC